MDAGENVAAHVPIVRIHVSYLLDSIDFKDLDVLVAAAIVRQTDPSTRDDFEKAAAFLCPNCSLQRQKKNNKNAKANDGAVGGNQEKGTANC